MISALPPVVPGQEEKELDVNLLKPLPKQKEQKCKEKVEELKGKEKVEDPSTKKRNRTKKGKKGRKSTEEAKTIPWFKAMTYSIRQTIYFLLDDRNSLMAEIIARSYIISFYLGAASKWQEVASGEEEEEEEKVPSVAGSKSSYHPGIHQHFNCGYVAGFHLAAYFRNKYIHINFIVGTETEDKEADVEAESVDAGEAAKLHGDKGEGNDGKEKECDDGVVKQLTKGSILISWTCLIVYSIELPANILNMEKTINHTKLQYYNYKHQFLGWIYRNIYVCIIDIH